MLLLALLCLPAVLRAQPLTVDPNTLDLGVVGVGVETRASVSIENMRDDGIEVIVGVSGDGFKALSDTLRLDGRGVGSIEVTFIAAAAGDYSGELTMQTAAWFNDQRVVVPLRAEAVVPPLELLPAGGLDFGAVPVGQVAMAVVVVRNTGTVLLPTGQVEIAELKGPFSVERDVGPWPAPGGETRIDVAFAPTRSGPVATEFVITAGDFGDWTIPLQGSGLVPEAAFSPLPQVGLEFGAVEVGQRLTRQVTVLNQGRAALQVENVAIEGAAFSLGTGDSSATIAPGGRLDLSAAFVPQYAGDRNGILRVYTNDPQAADVAIPLAGRGRIRPPRIEIVNGDIDFGSVRIGGTARSHLLLWNKGGQPGVAEVSVVGEEGVEFTLAQHSVLVQPGASAQVALSFSPKESGTRQAILRVEADAGRQTVRLQGVGRFSPSARRP